MDGEKPTSQALQNSWQGAPRQTDTTQEARRRKIVVVGVGASGNNTITQLRNTNMPNIYTVVVTTDFAQLNQTQADKKILIDKKSTSSKSAERNVVSGEISRKETKKQIEEIFKNVDVAFIITELDDSSEKRTASSVAEMASKKNAMTIGVVIKSPQTRNQKARPTYNTIRSLQQKCDTVLVIDKTQLTEFSSQLSLSEASNIAECIAANVIRRIIYLAASPNLAGPNFASFKNFMKHGGMTATEIGESNPRNNVEEAVHDGLKNPLASIGYTEAKRVQQIVTEIMENGAPVLWGIKIDPELDGKMNVTLAMTGTPSPQLTSSFDAIAPQLFNLEPSSEPEKKLAVDFGLYQLENFE